MDRRTLLKGIATASLVTIAPTGAAAAANARGPDGGAADGDCLPPYHEDCGFNQCCHEIRCPSHCCDCLCLDCPPQ